MFWEDQPNSWHFGIVEDTYNLQFTVHYTYSISSHFCIQSKGPKGSHTPTADNFYYFSIGPYYSVSTPVFSAYVINAFPCRCQMDCKITKMRHGNGLLMIFFFQANDLYSLLWIWTHSIIMVMPQINHTDAQHCN